MRRFLFAAIPALITALAVSCSGKDEPAKTVPNDFDTGFPVFETSPGDTNKPMDTSVTDSGMPTDTSVVDTGTMGDAYFPDIPMTMDSNPGDVIKLMEGGPPDAPPDTAVPDVKDMIDTAGVTDTFRPD